MKLGLEARPFNMQVLQPTDNKETSNVFLRRATDSMPGPLLKPSPEPGIRRPEPIAWGSGVILKRWDDDIDTQRFMRVAPDSSGRLDKAEAGINHPFWAFLK